MSSVWTALITPFTSDGKLDLDGLKLNVKDQIDAGIDGVLPLGTTGEAPCITHQERPAIISACVEVAAGKIPVMVGTGTYSTQETIERTKEAKDLGADCALIVTPYYSKPTQEGIYRHFMAVVEAVDFPIYVYNIKGRSVINIETSTLERIAQAPSIVGVKEASGDLAQVDEVLKSIKSKRPEFAVLSGDDALTLPIMSLGGDGVISVISNLLPELVVKLVRAMQNSDIDAARKTHQQLLPIFKAAFVESNPIPIKTALGIAGKPSGPVRLPLCEISAKNLEHLKEVIRIYL